MKNLGFLFIFGVLIFWGFKNHQEEKKTITYYKQISEDVALQKKSFVLLVYAYNQGPWVQKALESIFEQDYEHFRVIFIDDGSKDDTYSQAVSFIVDNNQSEKSLIIRNPEKIGYSSCLNQIVKTLLDQEVVIPIQAKDWLCANFCLSYLNATFQNPNIWMVTANAISYPWYKPEKEGLHAFYAGASKAKKNDTPFFNKNINQEFVDIDDSQVANLEEIFLIINESGKM